VDKTPHQNRQAGESLRARGERENAKPAPAKKLTVERIEASFDEFGEVYAIEMYEYLFKKLARNLLDQIPLV